MTYEMTAQRARNWHRFFRRIGLPHLSFHCTRVTVITRLARAGVPEQQAMRFIGHATLEVHRIYQKLKPGDLSSARLPKPSFGSLATTVLVLKSGWLLRNCRTHRIVVLRPQNQHPLFLIIQMDQAQYPISRAKCFGNANVSTRSPILSPSIPPPPKQNYILSSIVFWADRLASFGLGTSRYRSTQ